MTKAPIKTTLKPFTMLENLLLDGHKTYNEWKAENRLECYRRLSYNIPAPPYGELG